MFFPREYSRYYKKDKSCSVWECQQTKIFTYCNLDREGCRGSLGLPNRGVKLIILNWSEAT